jgi:SPP1 family predicted phage head-tail adaptor
MLAGKLRHRLTIQQPDDHVGTANEELPNYSTFATVWGSVEPLSGSEGLQLRQMGSTASHRIKIRFHARITNDMRVAWNSRYFYIESHSNPEERNREIELLCTERTTP